MKMFMIVRVPQNPDPSHPIQSDVCVGSSPISSKPYWEKLQEMKLDAKATIQPLLFRDGNYADTCATYAARDDKMEGDEGPFFYFAAEVEIGEINIRIPK